MVEIVQHQINGAEIGSIGVEQNRLTGDGNRVLDTGGIQGDVLDPLNDIFGATDGGGIRQLDVDQQVAFVLCRNKSRRRGGEAPPGQGQQSNVNHDDDEADAH